MSKEYQHQYYLRNKAKKIEKQRLRRQKKREEKLKQKLKNDAQQLKAKEESKVYEPQDAYEQPKPDKTELTDCEKFVFMMTDKMERDMFFCNEHHLKCSDCQKWLHKQRQDVKPIDGANMWHDNSEPEKLDDLNRTLYETMNETDNQASRKVRRERET